MVLAFKYLTLTDERVRNWEHKLQPVATTPTLYSTVIRIFFLVLAWPGWVVKILKVLVFLFDQFRT